MNVRVFRAYLLNDVNVTTVFVAGANGLDAGRRTVADRNDGPFATLLAYSLSVMPNVTPVPNVVIVRLLYKLGCLTNFLYLHGRHACIGINLRRDGGLGLYCLLLLLIGYDIGLPVVDKYNRPRVVILECYWLQLWLALGNRLVVASSEIVGDCGGRGGTCRIHDTLLTSIGGRPIFGVVF